MSISFIMVIHAYLNHGSERINAVNENKNHTLCVKRDNNKHKVTDGDHKTRHDYGYGHSWFAGSDNERVLLTMCLFCHSWKRTE